MEILYQKSAAHSQIRQQAEERAILMMWIFRAERIAGRIVMSVLYKK